MTPVSGSGMVREQGAPAAQGASARNQAALLCRHDIGKKRRYRVPLRVRTVANPRKSVRVIQRVQHTVPIGQRRKKRVAILYAAQW